MCLPTWLLVVTTAAVIIPMSEAMPLQPGQTFAQGRFVLVKRLGRGGMGEVRLLDKTPSTATATTSVASSPANAGASPAGQR
jgi:hypothetical protein